VKVGKRRWAPRLRHPAQAIVLGFGSAIALGTFLLSLPIAKDGDGSASLVDALFTATSAVCVTGLIVQDTPVYWSTFGEIVILILFQIGGFGIMTMASLLIVLVTRRMGLRSRLIAAAETKNLGLGDVRVVLFGVFKVTLLFEIVTMLVLTWRLNTRYDEPLGDAAYLATFHSVSAFNNAGFSLYSNSLMDFTVDPLVILPIGIAVICGGIGFPVMLELRRSLRHPRQWSLHTKLTVTWSAVLLVAGTAFVLLSEWRNAHTLQPLDLPGKLLASFFQSLTSRTAGFNSLDTAKLTEGTWLGTDVLMFIGGGSAGTAGGIKVTTFILLLYVIYAEVRGERGVNVFDRKIDPRAQRQALTIALLAMAAVVSSTLFMMEFTPHSLDKALFEVVSAFGTVGLSTGITGDLQTPAKILITILMFIGRLGPITLASALALRQRDRMYELPEGRPIIG
jgi:potassium uptake TrkH family protein